MRALSYGLGQQYFDDRNYRAAIQALLPIVEQTPEDVGTRLLLARAYFHSALLKPAEQHLLEIIERTPTEYYAHLLMARTLERLNRAEEATKHRRITAALTGDDSHLASQSLSAK
ncbi:tetratricopeptide repeat protein [Kribbella sp. CA-293567]|uniref:tetratricopeptide repeat protein n=1 Tax=Kribbella sp. CA-293567 TaxID=3002436 RepID=UPI0022DDA234|nr:tetratricopeptide repeat protein [Kribbella sp. CA-293567]WBQ05154.1 tetratricopeptide repeat protein [Kribbella sp. CA-293567]